MGEVVGDFRYVPFILAFPILGLLVNLALGRRLRETWIGGMASGASGLAFDVAVWTMAELSRHPQGVRNLKNAGAARKPFVVNRVGDFAFLLSILLIFWTFGSLRYSDVFSKTSEVLLPGAPVAHSLSVTPLARVNRLHRSRTVGSDLAHRGLD